MAKTRKGKRSRPAEEVAPAQPPLTPVATSGFKRDYRLQASRGMDMDKIQAVIDRIVERRPLDPSHTDHPLRGRWKGCRDCHVEPDWILIYEVTPTELILHRTGTHSDLF